MSETNKPIFSTSFVDIVGLSKFWEKTKEYIDGQGDNITKIIEDNEMVTATALTDLDSRVSGNASEIAKIQGELDALSGGAGSITTQINNAIDALKLPDTYLKIADGTITMTETAGSDNILKTYTFKQGDTTIGSINLAKDLVVTSGSIVVDNGVNCLELVLSSGDIVHIPVSDLVGVDALTNYYTKSETDSVASGVLAEAKAYTNELGVIVKGVYDNNNLISEGHEQRIEALENISIASESQILAIFEQ